MKIERKSYQEAWGILRHWCMKLDGKEPSSNKDRSKPSNLQGKTQEWWLAHQGTLPAHDSPRSRAYLRSYDEIAGETFYGSGISLKGGVMHPDRGIMKSLLLAGCVTLGATKAELFELTTKGRELIAGLPD